MTLVRSGSLKEALLAAEAAVRGRPTDPGCRIALAEACLLHGDWERARVHAGVAGDLEPSHKVFADLVETGGAGEVVRAGVLSGRLTPVVFGEPEAWVARQIELCGAIARNETERAQGLLAESGATEGPPLSATIDGAAAPGFVDSDSRLGSMFEAFFGGKYYWVPMSRVALLVLEKPTSLWNLVWGTAVMKLINGGEVPCVMPVRYPFSGGETGEQLLSRVTEWAQGPAGAWIGRGQRTWMAGDAQFGMLDARRIEIRVESGETNVSEARDAG